MGMSEQQVDELAEVITLRWRPVITFGARLRLIRIEFGKRRGKRCTQTEMAFLLGVQEGTYKQWEASNNLPADLVTMAKLVGKVTGSDTSWLLDVADEPSGPDGGSVIDESKNACTRYPLVTDLAERRKAA